MKRLLCLLPLVLLCGCTLLRTDMVPKPVWYWDARAKYQREQDALEKLRTPDWNTNFNQLPARATNSSIAIPASEPLTELAQKIQKRDGTNFLWQFMGMIAELDGWTNKVNFQGVPKQPPYQGVMMFSATSGQLLRWISYDEFEAVYVRKTRKEYP